MEADEYVVAARTVRRSNEHDGGKKIPLAPSNSAENRAKRDLLEGPASSALTEARFSPIIEITKAVPWLYRFRDIRGDSIIDTFNFIIISIPYCQIARHIVFWCDKVLLRHITLVTESRRTLHGMLINTQ